jgi:hypothetical protein
MEEKNDAQNCHVIDLLLLWVAFELTMIAKSCATAKMLLLLLFLVFFGF